MLDGVRREFPKAFELARRIPNPRVARASGMWAVLAAFGAGFFVSSAILVVLMLFARFIGMPTEWIGGVATAAAVATGLSVAYTASGPGAVAVYVGIVILEDLLRLPSLMRFCSAIVGESSACSLVFYVLGLWPEGLGVVVATRLYRWMRAAEGDGNRLLEAAGALALTQGVVVSVLGGTVLAASAFASGVMLLFSAVAGGVACGYVLLRRVEPARQWRSLALIALAVMGVWLLVSVPSFAGQAGVGGAIAIGGVNLLGFAAPLFEVGSAAVVLYMSTARTVTPTSP
jgi:hypothetical protein